MTRSPGTSKRHALSNRVAKHVQRTLNLESAQAAHITPAVLTEQHEGHLVNWLTHLLDRLSNMTAPKRAPTAASQRTVGDLFSPQGTTKFDRVDHITVMRAETEDD